VVTDEAAGHRPFDELAAGYALDALEPADEQRFLQHAGECPDCAGTLAGYREVAAALADTAPPAEPSPQLADRIMAAALADLGTGQPVAPPARAGDAEEAGRGGEPEDTGPARENTAAAAGGPPPAVVPLRPRARRWLRPATAAAAAVLIAAGGIWGGLAATSTSSKSSPSVASCGHERGCAEVTLTAAATHRTSARVLVQRGMAWLVPSGMKADDTADQTYVLWQITASHRPLAVGSFDVRAGTHAPIRIGGLAAPYGGTLAFAVSLEHGRTIPAAPSHIAALGQVS
jgi:anti-sigma-K factor RskA